MIKLVIISALLAGGCLPLAPHAETFDTCTAFIDSVPATLEKQGVYCLQKDVATNQTDGDAIGVRANNVTIDCNGYKIGGLAAGPTTQAYGVYASGRQNVIVRNCNIRGFMTGASIRGDGVLIENNSFNQNTTSGISVSGAGGLVRNNRVLDTGIGATHDAMGVFSSGGVDIRDNTIDGVGGVRAYGIFVQTSDGSIVSNNTIRNFAPSGAATGIYVVHSKRIFLDGNRTSLAITTDAAHTGYLCAPSAAALRGNSSWGFKYPMDSNCLDSGGNLSY